MKKVITLILIFVLIITNINSQSKAFGKINFGMSKKEVKIFKLSDTLYFDKYIFMVNPMWSIFSKNDSLEVLRLGLLLNVFSNFNDNEFKKLTDLIYDNFNELKYNCIFKHDFYNSGIMSKNSIILIFQNEYKSIIVESGDISYNTLSHEPNYYIILKIMKNNYLGNMIKTYDIYKQNNIKNNGKKLD